MFVNNNLLIVEFTPPAALSKRGWVYFLNCWRWIMWDPAEMAEIQGVLGRRLWLESQGVLPALKKSKGVFSPGGRGSG